MCSNPRLRRTASVITWALRTAAQGIEDRTATLGDLNEPRSSPAETPSASRSCARTRSSLTRWILPRDVLPSREPACYILSMDYELTLAVLRALADHGVEYRVVGGVALNLRGLARATVDLDIFVAPDEENVRRLRRALHQVFEDPEIDEITAADLAGEYPVIQYVPPAGVFHIDILARLGEQFTYEDIEYDELEIDGIPVPVATAQMLYRMKQRTVRPRDHADAARLRRRYGFAEDDDAGS